MLRLSLKVYLPGRSLLFVCQLLANLSAAPTIPIIEFLNEYKLNVVCYYHKLFTCPTPTTPNDQTSHFALQSPLIASGGIYAGVPLLFLVHVESISSPDTASLKRPKSATLKSRSELIFLYNFLNQF